jgi:Zn-dependent peptidase ImmA (M78 family)/DNA-binding XRE family transcriptional regulator
MIFGDRVRQAREVRGLTQTELAEHLRVGQYVIARIEAGVHQPDASFLDALSLRLGFPPAFFRQEPRTEFPLGSLLFRSRNALTARDRDMARSYAETIYDSVETMLPKLKGVPALRLPRLTCAPVEAARITRAELGLAPEAPIKHLIHAVEKAGVFVIALPFSVAHFDAFSAWAGADELRPVIVLVGGAPSDRVRYSMAHEIGHLVLHQAKRGLPAALHQEADQFAGEFLLPEAAMRREVTSPVTLTSIAQLKVRWGVSMQALIQSARRLDIITERQQKYLYTQMAARGWRTEEPSNLAPSAEKPRLFRKMLERYFETPDAKLDSRRIAEAFSLSPQMVKDIVEAHAERNELPRKSELNDAVPENVVQFPRRDYAGRDS